MKPVVAVVGRPNVGKSTLVNRIAQTSDAIVHESRGVTRDRSYHDAEWNGREFTLVDTGGIESYKSEDVFSAPIRDQALAAAEEACAILFVVDGTTGITEEDETVARILKRVRKPVFCSSTSSTIPTARMSACGDLLAGRWRSVARLALHGHGTGDLARRGRGAVSTMKTNSKTTPPMTVPFPRHHRPPQRGQVVAVQQDDRLGPLHRVRRGRDHAAMPSTRSWSTPASCTAWLTPPASARRAPYTRTSSTTRWFAACAPSTAPTSRCSSSTPRPA